MAECVKDSKSADFPTCKASASPKARFQLQDAGAELQHPSLNFSADLIFSTHPADFQRL